MKYRLEKRNRFIRYFRMFIPRSYTEVYGKDNVYKKKCLNLKNKRHLSFLLQIFGDCQN